MHTMKIKYHHCCFIVSQLAVLLLQINEADASTYCGSYTVQVKCGTWGWKKCNEKRCHASGDFTCRCPGNGATIKYNIACRQSGSSCIASNAGKNCDKYINCATCHARVDEYAGGCSSCRAGFALKAGFCHEDINECLRNPCQHTCTNTHGSYYCSCHRGYILQPAGQCLEVDCARPPSVVNGDIIPVTSYTFNNYSQYSCNNGLLLHGNVVRKCLADSANAPYWGGSSPSCVDTCSLTESTPRQQCGPPSVTQSECLQLGCCFSREDGQSSCYFRQEMGWVTNRGERISETALETLQEYSTSGCGYSCLTTPACKAFVVQRQPFDKVHHQTCQLFDRPRSQLAIEKVIEFGDQAYDLHEPLASDSRGADDQDRLYSLFVGCYDVLEANKSVPVYRVWSSASNNPARCVTACRQQGYNLAELQNGAQCYCGDEVSVDYTDYNSSNCVTPCSGRPEEMCGGENSRSVYRVPADSRYVGCFEFLSESVDFPLHLWTRPGRTSASDCIAGCLQRDNNYAAVHDGQHCYCGNSFVSHWEQPYSECREKCSERTHEDCGGPSTQAVYATGLGSQISSDMQRETTYRHLFSTNTRTIEVPFQLFTIHPRLRAITTPRLVIRLTGSVDTPTESVDCLNEACYSACSVLSPYDTEGLQYRGRDQIVRFFHLNLTDLTRYVGSDAQRVFVYAQTVLIDANQVFPFSLLIHTRRLILDRSMSRAIHINSNSPTFNLQFDDHETFGIHMDSMFAKQSFMCARILLDTRQQDDVNTALAILDDLANSNATGASLEQSAWFSSVRMFNVFLKGIDRHRVHFVPFYSMDYFRRILQLFSDRITIYDEDFKTLIKESTTDSSYIQKVESLVGNFALTSVAEARQALEASLRVLGTSNATFHRVKDQFDAVAERLIANDLPEGIERRVILWSALKSFLKNLIGFFVKLNKASRAKMELENRKIEAAALAREAQNVLELRLSNLTTSLCSAYSYMGHLLWFVNASNEAIANLVSEDQSSFDFMKFSDDIEEAASMKDVIVHWELIEHDVLLILRHPNVEKNPGCVQYLSEALRMAEWGAALSKAAIEHAELLRDAIQKKYTLDGKLMQHERYRKYIDELRVGNIAKQQMTAAMVEQLQDVRIDLNNLLFTFCQAYFFDKQRSCPSDVRPSFGGSLSQLLLKINRALEESLTFDSSPSTVSRQLIIADGNDCTDCPVKTFRETGLLNLQVDVTNPTFSDLFTYRVRTLYFEFSGVRPNPVSGDSSLKVMIDSSGIFQSREINGNYDFVTSSRALAFEYDIISGDISMCADVYTFHRNTVQHVTPYTTWVVRLSSRSLGLDFSGLSQIKIRFVGSATNAEFRGLTKSQPWNPCG